MTQIPFKIPCVILSGGKSQRMGEDKSLLPFSSSKTLIEYQYNRLKPYFNDTFISSKINKFLFLKDSSKLILDENKDIYSPILALQTILKRFDKVFIITVDTPFVKIETIKELIEHSEGFDVVIAKDEEKTHNLCGVFSNKCLKIINQMIEENIHKINYLIKQTNFKIINSDYQNEFININDKTDYRRALNII
ncbi:putative molybdenum cofactor guanylyltransferase [Aliarcobacter thereius]|uniref:Probable molybdenum cofactor guanylyltransferase n=2 Tax=Aliarcobacter thereius TaxID=544718 RepID=A0A1C0B9P2_9BACT|nr:NTP transferase domain-containing protein [Aliarcobacter thereius]OCL88543.1 putative molybdenum cofactor guanylyltransferase [Aliarcobacter thereius]OCL92034.1 putative molybdenum cofactor guanylyltransferase [Aliarcobacter thereius]OCL94870.1 putative molybdenum cofactor guanylyltransferase [Aliarcobacter thereius LMG 24486]OCM00317.1 putative molybdenum cofactor guanylyltransferase [Aliarcobacter thereius]QBF15256.1 molybdenum cofactor guanylyltransferase protein A [Aliarcobacter thereiu